MCVRVKKNGTKNEKKKSAKTKNNGQMNSAHCVQANKKKGNETINDVSISDSNNLSPRIQEKKTTT